MNLLGWARGLQGPLLSYHFIIKGKFPPQWLALYHHKHPSPSPRATAVYFGPYPNYPSSVVGSAGFLLMTATGRQFLLLPEEQEGRALLGQLTMQWSALAHLTRRKAYGIQQKGPRDSLFTAWGPLCCCLVVSQFSWA